MAKQRNLKPKRKITSSETPKQCPFCRDKKNPDFVDYEMLSRFTSERGKIYNRAKSGVCAKHQRKLTIAIKRARHLAFLPFIVRAD